MVDRKQRVFRIGYGNTVISVIACKADLIRACVFGAVCNRQCRIEIIVAIKRRCPLVPIGNGACLRAQNGGIVFAVYVAERVRTALPLIGLPLRIQRNDDVPRDNGERSLRRRIIESIVAGNQTADRNGKFAALLHPDRKAAEIERCASRIYIRIRAYPVGTLPACIEDLEFSIGYVEAVIHRRIVDVRLQRGFGNGYGKRPADRSMVALGYDIVNLVRAAVFRNVFQFKFFRIPFAVCILGQREFPRRLESRFMLYGNVRVLEHIVFRCVVGTAVTFGRSRHFCRRDHISRVIRIAVSVDKRYAVIFVCRCTCYVIGSGCGSDFDRDDRLISGSGIHKHEGIRFLAVVNRSSRNSLLRTFRKCGGRRQFRDGIPVNGGFIIDRNGDLAFFHVYSSRAGTGTAVIYERIVFCPFAELGRRDGRRVAAFQYGRARAVIMADALSQRRDKTRFVCGLLLVSPALCADLPLAEFLAVNDRLIRYGNGESFWRDLVVGRLRHFFFRKAIVRVRNRGSYRVNAHIGRADVVFADLRLVFEIPISYDYGILFKLAAERQLCVCSFAVGKAVRSFFFRVGI